MYILLLLVSALSKNGALRSNTSPFTPIHLLTVAAACQVNEIPTYTTLKNVAQFIVIFYHDLSQYILLMRC